MHYEKLVLLFLMCSLGAALANTQEENKSILSVDRFSWDNHGRRTIVMGNWWCNCYEFLHNYLKTIQRDEIDRCSNEDLKKYYYDACRAAGASFSEAKEKVNSVVFD